MRPQYSHTCPYCYRRFHAVPPGVVSCPHCNSVLEIDYERAILLRPGVKPAPQGTATVGGTVLGALIGGSLGGPPGAVIGGLIGLLIGGSADAQQRGR